MSPLQNCHPGRSRLDDPRRPRCPTSHNGNLCSNNAILSCLQLRYKASQLSNAPLSAYPCNICSYRIIEPLASRCSKFRFTPLDSESAAARLAHIAQQEHVEVNKPVIDALINVSNGDLRRAITYLQSASRLSSASDPPAPILPSDIQEIAGVVPDKVINDFARTLGIEVDDDDIDMDDSKLKKPNFSAIQKKVKAIIREGYSATQILSQVSSLFLVYNKIY